jgi:hypothetical protein
MEPTKKKVKKTLNKLLNDIKFRDDYEKMLNLRIEINEAIEEYNLKEYIEKYNSLARKLYQNNSE